MWQKLCTTSYLSKEGNTHISISSKKTNNGRNNQFFKNYYFWGKRDRDKKVTFT